MIAASRLAEVDRELEAFGVEPSKLDALQRREFSTDEVDAFLSGAHGDVQLPQSSGVMVVSLDEVTVVPEAAADALVAMSDLPAVQTSVSSFPPAAFEPTAPSQEILLDDDVVVPRSSPTASSSLATMMDEEEDSDFPMDGTELIQSGAQELELEFDGDLAMGSEPLHFETPATGTSRSVRPSRAPLSQADLDAELAAILADPDDLLPDAAEPSGPNSVDVELDVADDLDVSMESSVDAVDVGPEDGAPTSSTRPPPLPARPSSAPPADESPGFLGRLLNKK